MIAPRSRRRLAVLIACFPLGLSDLPAQAPVPTQWGHPDGTIHAYRAVAVAGGIRWSEAHAAAAEAGGYLATITSAGENAVVAGLVAGAGFWTLDVASNTYHGPWLGGLQVSPATEPGGGWRWAEVEPFDYQNWSPGQPDDNAQADRIHFGGNATAGSPTWADDPADARMPGYVIEFSGPLALRTVGLLQRAAGSFDGYTLLAPGSSRLTFLLDPRGRVVNTWASYFTPGQSAYLLPNGNLLRCGKIGYTSPPAGGDGGVVEEFDWQGNQVWSFTHASPTYLQHHDIEALPNGNVLMIVWDFKSGAEAIAAGRDPAKMRDGHLWPDKIIEVQKTGPQAGKIVWEWNAWDHLVQDHDATKANYGDPAKSPHRIDLNYAPETIGDWMHTNAIAYNARLDQVMISVRSFEEFWIIDHSTTTQQAAGSTGGRSGRGGDLLYRWGNPYAYRAGQPQARQLFLQHDAHWIPDGLPGGGNILVFNNGRNRPGGDESTVEEIVPPAVDSSGNYPMTNGSWGPAAPAWTYRAKDPAGFYSAFVSGAQRQPNGNTLICSGWIGRIREVDPQGATVWEYVNPFLAGLPMSQGSMPAAAASMVFRAPRYGPSYPAFQNRTLVPGEPLERHASVLLADGSTAPHRVAVGESVDFTLRVAGGTGRLYQVATSATPGLLPIDFRFARVGYDPLLEMSLFENVPTVFSKYRGILDIQGQARPRLSIPAIPALRGLTLHTMFVVVDAAAPSSAALLSNTVSVEITN